MGFDGRLRRGFSFRYADLCWHLLLAASPKPAIKKGGTYPRNDGQIDFARKFAPVLGPPMVIGCYIGALGRYIAEPSRYAEPDRGLMV